MKENKRYKAVELDENDKPIPGTETILWHSRSMAVTCVIVCEGKDGTRKYLLEKRGPGCPDNIGKYVFPCGYLNWDETLKQAVIREVYEETGLTLRESEIVQFGIEDKVTANRQNVTVRFKAVVSLESVEKMIKLGLINTNTESRGGEAGECDDLVLVDYDWIRKHYTDLAFGHEALVDIVEAG